MRMWGVPAGRFHTVTLLKKVCYLFYVVPTDPYGVRAAVRDARQDLSSNSLLEAALGQGRAQRDLSIRVQPASRNEQLSLGLKREVVGVPHAAPLFPCKRVFEAITNRSGTWVGRVLGQVGGRLRESRRIDHRKEVFSVLSGSGVEIS